MGWFGTPFTMNSWSFDYINYLKWELDINTIKYRYKKTIKYGYKVFSRDHKKLEEEYPESFYIPIVKYTVKNNVRKKERILFTIHNIKGYWRYLKQNCVMYYY